jgi:hypothetical protein
MNWHGGFPGNLKLGTVYDILKNKTIILKNTLSNLTRKKWSHIG